MNDRSADGSSSPRGRRDAPGAEAQGTSERDAEESPFPRLVLNHPEGGTVEIFLQGAHVGTWTMPGEGDLIFLSERARLESGVPIRGGIPIVFPQFSDRGPLPKHGFARTRRWTVVESGTGKGGQATALLRLSDDEETRELWPHAFVAEFAVTLSSELTTTLRVTNVGGEPFTFTSALHTYYQVKDVRRVSVHGLEGSRYLGLEPGGDPVKVSEPLRIVGETDGVYAGVTGSLRIVDASGNRTIAIESDGFSDAVVWNPWVELARELPDLADDEYLTMICVEPANIAVPTELAPRQTWSGTQRIRVTKGS